MIGFVQCGPNQIVHTGINNDKIFLSLLLGVDDLGEQDTGWPYQGTAWLQNEVEICGKDGLSYGRYP